VIDAARALALALWIASTAQAQSPEATQPLPTREIAPGVHVHAGVVGDWEPGNGGDIANLAFVVGKSCVAVIDTGGTPRVGRQWQAAITAVTTLPVCFVINTHAHPDHVLGNNAFAGDAKSSPQFMAHAKMAAALAARERYYLHALQRDFGIDMPRTDLVYPTVGVEPGTTTQIDLGGRVLELTAWPTAHTDHDLSVFDRATGTLFLGDLLFVTHLPVIDGSLRGWVKVMDSLESRSVAWVVPGHGAVSRDWPQPMKPQAQYLRAVLAQTRAAVKAGTTIQRAVETVGRDSLAGWALSEQFHARNVTSAFAELEWED